LRSSLMLKTMMIALAARRNEIGNYSLTFGVTL
jgi:hypothetical protein